MTMVQEKWAQAPVIEQRVEGAYILPDYTLRLSSEFQRFIVAVCPECGQESHRVTGNDFDLNARRELYPWSDRHQATHNRDRGLI